MKTKKDYLRGFFKDNQIVLEKAYPGINPSIILKFCFALHGKGCRDIFEFNNTYACTNFRSTLNILLEGRPLEYISSEVFFYKSLFYVDERVLIPRDETEILVEKAIGIIQQNEIKKICEVGVGSGAIFLSILEETKKKLEVLATDIDHSALEVAIKNYQLKKYKINDKHHVEFKKHDRLNNINQQFDLIISNPPYIKEQADIEGVHAQVHSHEPHVALYLKDCEYNQWFETFFKQVFLCLNKCGYFLMEGHEDHLQQLLELGEAIGFDGELIQDYTQRDRFIILKK